MKLKYPLEVNPGTTITNKTGGWRTQKPIVDHEICIGCDVCRKVCPEGVCFPTGEKNSKGRIFYDRDLDFCKGCGLCAKECPVSAIRMENDFK
ncbi:4Fe-4S dicluster domain-containing protein [Candidatus Falkowbacteria bacterium]|nr:4Fe-4S dicluster domain-containing protein [Candidatus Falkowbacteria bacterium]